MLYCRPVYLGVRRMMPKPNGSVAARTPALIVDGWTMAEDLVKLGPLSTMVQPRQSTAVAVVLVAGPFAASDPRIR